MSEKWGLKLSSSENEFMVIGLLSVTSPDDQTPEELHVIAGGPHRLVFDGQSCRHEGPAFGEAVLRETSVTIDAPKGYKVIVHVTDGYSAFYPGDCGEWLHDPGEDWHRPRHNGKENRRE